MVNAKSPQFPEIDWVVKLYTACTFVDLIMCIPSHFKVKKSNEN